MNNSKDNDQTFVLKILDDLRSNNRSKPLRMHYDTSMGLSSNDSLLSNKRRRSCSPDLEESIISNVEYLNNKTKTIMNKNLYFQTQQFHHGNLVT